MKKSIIIIIIVIVIMLILISNLIFSVLFLNKFHRNMRPPTDQEKEQCIKIINNTLGIDDNDVVFGNVFEARDKKLVQIEIFKNNTKKLYIIDLNKGKIVRK